MDRLVGQVMVTLADKRQRKTLDAADGGRSVGGVGRSSATRMSLAIAAQRRLGFSQSESRRLVDDIFTVLSDFLVEEGKVKVASFGSFSVRSKSARIGRNPKTGEIVPIAPRRVVSFRPSVALRERLRGAKDDSEDNDEGEPSSLRGAS